MYLTSIFKENTISSRRLYHGSFYKTDTLKPGILYSGKEIFWDETESNKYLYATLNRELAIQMGFASALTQIGLDVHSFESNDKEIIIKSNPKLTSKLLSKIGGIYLYTIPLNNKWKVINNEVNNAVDEYKTDSVITNIISRENINIMNWLHNYNLKFN